MMNRQFQTAALHSQAPTSFENSSLRLQQPGVAANSYFKRGTNVYQQNGQNTAPYSKTPGFSYQKYSINDQFSVGLCQNQSQYSKAQTSCNSPCQSAYQQQPVTRSWQRPALQEQMRRGQNQQNPPISNQNGNGMLAKFWPTYMSTATSLPQGQTVCTANPVSASANSQQVRNNQIYGHATEPRFSHSVSPTYTEDQTQLQRKPSSFTSNSYGYGFVPIDWWMTTNSQPPPYRPPTTADTSKFGPSYSAREMTIRQIVQDLKKSYHVDEENGRPVAVNSHPQNINRASSVTATLNDCGNSTQRNIFSRGNLVQFSEDASQPVTHNSDILAQALAPALNNQDEISTYSNSGLRAVAVVQPLSKESYQVVHNNHSSDTQRPQDERTATDISLLNSRKKSITPPFDKNIDNLDRCYANLQDTNLTKMYIQQLVATSGNTVVSPLNSAGLQDSQIHLANEADAQMSKTSHLPERQNTDTEKIDLSSAKTNPWTLVNLNNFKPMYEKHQTNKSKNSDSCTSTFEKICSLYDVQTFLGMIKSGWYKKLMDNVNNFCKNNITADAVILTELEQSQMNQIQNINVLKDGEVYSEPTYISSWLNINEKLDDIDKEFGYPFFLRSQFYPKGSDIQLDVMDEANSGEDFEKDFEQTQPKHIDFVEGNQCSGETTTSTTSSCSDDTDAVEPSDPYYSFEIQVLSPGEAKAIAKSVHHKAPITTDSQEETVKKTPTEKEESETSVHVETRNDDSVTLTESEQKYVSPVKKGKGICCLSKWLEIICDTEPTEKCNCENEQSQTGRNQTPLNEEEKADDVNSKPSLHDNESSSPETQDELKPLNNVGSNNETQRCASPSKKICVDLSQDDEIPLPHSQEEGKTGSNYSRKDNQLSIADVAKSADDVYDCPSDINQIPNLCISEECMQEPEESLKKDDPEISATTSQELESIIRSDPELPTSHGEANRPKDKMEPSHMALDKTTQSYKSKTSDLKLTIELSQRPGIKRRAPKSHEMLPFPKKARIFSHSGSVIPQLECKDDSTKKVSETSTRMTLMLYSSGGVKPGLDGSTLPSRVLTVNTGSPKTKTSSVCPTKYSAKELVRDTWLKSFIPTTVKHKVKKKQHNCSSVSGEDKKRKIKQKKKKKKFPQDKYFTQKSEKAKKMTKDTLIQMPKELLRGNWTCSFGEDVSPLIQEASSVLLI